MKTEIECPGCQCDYLELLRACPDLRKERSGKGWKEDCGKKRRGENVKAKSEEKARENELILLS
jgi:hypothetical protein